MQPTTLRRILIACSAYPPDIKGGGEKSVQILAQSLSTRGHTVRILTVADKAGDRLDGDGATRISQVASPNIYWNFHPQSSTFKKVIWHALDNFNPRATRVVAKAIQDFRPDIVVSSSLENFGPAIWRASRRMGVPVVHILRSYYVKCLRGTMFSNGRSCDGACAECSVLTLGRRVAARDVNGLIGISDFILNQHIPIFPKAMHLSIPNAVPATDTPVRRRAVAPVVTFGYLGRLEPEKGIQEILEVFGQLPDHCHLLVAGTGRDDYASKLREKYSSERIRFVGWVPAESVYPVIDFAVIPSLWNEPFGRVVIEAYAHGVPVVAAARGGLTELVRDGVTGYLFDPAIPSDLQAACMRAVAAMPSYDHLAAAAREESARYRPSEIARAYEKFFDTVLNG
ncbi:MAG: glycosyltransferase family 4 protein [Rhodoferax sp.]|nr:glycosyltransferase family 4 protein [Rhodoferax sp.]